MFHGIFVPITKQRPIFLPENHILPISCENCFPHERNAYVFNLREQFFLYFTPFHTHLIILLSRHFSFNCSTSFLFLDICSIFFLPFAYTSPNAQIASTDKATWIGGAGGGDYYLHTPVK